MVGVLLTAGCSGGGADLARDYPAAGPGTGGSAGAWSWPLGKEAEGGEHSFTLVRTACGISSVGEGGVVRTPQGQFCRADVRVSNDTDESAGFSVASLSAVVGEGTLPADAVASVYDGAEPLFAVQGGEGVETSVYFDVPLSASRIDEVVLAPGWLPRQLRVATN